jgi:hypothetical protein
VPSQTRTLIYISIVFLFYVFWSLRLDKAYLHFNFSFTTQIFYTDLLSGVLDRLRDLRLKKKQHSFNLDVFFLYLSKIKVHVYTCFNSIYYIWLVWREWISQSNITWTVKSYMWDAMRSLFQLTNLVVMGTDCIGSCKSHYHMITTTVPPFNGTVK